MCNLYPAVRIVLAGFGVSSAVLFCSRALGVPSGTSGDSGTDKSGYNLFNPTPASLLRELTPDRPDKTESPYTVDAGHIQLEMDFVNYAWSETDGLRTEVWNIAPLNLKVGLCNNTDLQLVFDNYLQVRTKNGAVVEDQSGVGDLTTRLKINLWGDDAGRTALALLPFIKFPTNTGHVGNRSVEGGMILPLAVKLPGGWDLGLESAASLLRNEGGRGYHGDFIASVTCDHSIVGKLSGYLEYFCEISSERFSARIGTVDSGLEYTLGENVQLDCGCNFGVTRSADVANPFTGITVRF